MTIKSDRWIKSMCIHPSRLNTANYGLSIEQLKDSRANEVLQTPLNADSFGQGNHWNPMIEGFHRDQVKINPLTDEKIISHGVSSYGYDVRCSNEFKIFTNIHSTIVDPKNFDEKNFVDFKGDVCIIPPNSFALARTVEYFRIPRDVLTICLGKSTYARCGIIVNVTPLEPEWEGHVTLEFSNTTNLPAKIYANEGVAQMLFFKSNESCEVSYKDRGGKYQGQTGVTLPKV